VTLESHLGETLLWDHLSVPEERSVVALFAGIGGIEEGVSRSGFHPVLLCENWAPAQSVLHHRFPDVPIAADVEQLRSLPAAELVTAGFPCTDLSQAGRTAGIEGRQSGLVRKALSLVEKHKARWLLLENVRNMLPLHNGQAMRAITSELERMGFRWAYRVVDSRFTGVPQRRQRVLLLASRKEDPRPVLFSDDAGVRPDDNYNEDSYGFYWTEGLRGLGWCRDGVPTLKGGSTIGIPSAPAIWIPGGRPGSRFVTPGIATLERLQGFRKGWTAAASSHPRGEGARSKLVGNAVTVGVSAWVGRGLVEPGIWDESLSSPLAPGSRWPMAAWGDTGRTFRVDVSMWPQRAPYKHLMPLMGEDYTRLSTRATAGFLSRLERGNLRVPEEFRIDMKEHIEVITELG
jgi:DNA (cytosine-5)-methyltransferase 1